MKRILRKVVAASAAIAAASALTGCGANNSGGTGTGVIPTPIVTTPVTSCVPITSPIAFTATGISFDWANIRGGTIPADVSVGRYQSVTAGTITIGTGTVAVQGGQYVRSGVDGTITMNITAAGNVTYPTNYPSITTPSYYPGYPFYPGGYSNNQLTATTASGTGVITISQATQTDIAYVTGAYTNTGTTTTAPCVSAIAIDVGHYQNMIYGGFVYLYLNNTQNGYKLYF